MTEYASWQDRQLAAIAERMAQLSGELARVETLARELGRTSAFLEIREADLLHWKEKAADLENQLQRQAEIERDLRAAGRSLEEELARLRAIEKNYAAENQSLASRAAAAAYEAATLRRLAAEIEQSLSWKITAPLRFLTRPLFRALAPRPAPPAPTAPPQETISIAPAAAAPQPASPEPHAPDPMDAILAELRRAGAIAVIPCAIPFSAVLNQRPIACARHLAEGGTTVLYVAWQWSPGDAVPQAFEQVYPRVFHIPLYAFLAHIDRIAAASHARSAYLCTLPSPALAEIIRPLRAAGYHIHYDIMDDWEEFHRGGEAPWFSADVEREVVVAADSVSAVSAKLVRKFAHLRSDIAEIRNGYRPAALDCEPFLSARAPLELPKTVGYFGHLSDAWFDWDAVFHAAQKLPAIRFELIGWAVSDRSRARMAELPNIHFAGLVPQADLHRYVRKWWAGMIPFRPSEVSAAVDPLKIYEYLHFGLPTVVTGICGIADYPLVRYAGSHDAFAEAFAALPDRPDETTLSEVAAFLKGCVWEERFAGLDRMLAAPAGLASLYR